MIKARVEKTADKQTVLILEIPLFASRPSASGKTRVVASTGGFTDTEAKVEGSQIRVNITATIPTKG